MQESLSPLLYRENTKKYFDPEIFAEAYSRMPQERQKKIDRMAFQKDKCLSLAAGCLLQRALEEAGISDRRLALSKNGKPSLADPSIPFRFSLSHSGEEALCAVNPGFEEIGCDVEAIKVPDMKVAERFFHPDEFSLLLSAEGQKQAETFYRLWTLKESFLKVTGLGFSLPLKDFRIFWDEAGRIQAEQSVNEKSYRFGSEIEGEYALAWCLEL